MFQLEGTTSIGKECEVIFMGDNPFYRDLDGRISFSMVLDNIDAGVMVYDAEDERA